MKTSLKNQVISNTYVALAAVAMLCGAAGTVGAQTVHEPASITKAVGYGDLNLETEQGAKVLYARLRVAANEVCSIFNSRDLGVQHMRQACYDHAVTGAVAQINKASLSALHNAQSRAAKEVNRS